MTEKAHDKDLYALKADIANLRDVIAGFAAGVKKSAGSHAQQSRAAAEQEGSITPSHDEESQGAWADLLHKFDSSRVQSIKVFKDLAVEVEKHPLIGIAASFGLGYIVAKLWYQENRQ